MLGRANIGGRSQQSEREPAGVIEHENCIIGELCLREHFYRSRQVALSPSLSLPLTLIRLLCTIAKLACIALSSIFFLSSCWRARRRRRRQRQQQVARP